ncbi:MAG TPA: hypothetical protein VFO39_09625 [Candidatus Sulfotelmatobacter sp.]|nr:hypothetical protein [Candidatus Sulfotelmatobacter sp.]
MQRKIFGAMFAVVLLGTLVLAQAQPAGDDYLDVFTVQVKPEKRADFDSIAKRIAAANRQNNGDTWIAMETTYGPSNRITFVSQRRGYADVETAMGTFANALQKSMGKAGADKLLQDFNQCITNSRSEIRRRRWDLSSNGPTDAAAYARLISESRWLRTTAVHVRPGQVAAFEDMLRDLKTAREKTSPPQTVFVSQAVAGQDGTVFYVTSLQKNLGAFDNMPSMPQMLGDEGYAKFLKTNAETVSGTEAVINRFVPEISNPPEEVLALAPDFWKPMSTSGGVNAKGKTAKGAAVNAAETSKMNNKEQKP